MPRNDDDLGFEPHAASDDDLGFEPHKAQGQIGDSIANFAKEHLPPAAIEALGIQHAFRGGMAKGGTLGNLSTPDMEQANADHPVAGAVGNLAGTMATGGALGAGAGAVAKGMGMASSGLAGLLGRVGMNTAASGLQGGLRAPADGQTRLGNATHDATIGGLTSLGLEGLLGAGKGIANSGPVQKFLRRGAAFNEGQADAYMQNPAQVENLATQMGDPKNLPAIQDQAKDAIQNSRRMLRTQGLKDASEVSGILNAKVGPQAPVSPQSLQGITPEIDSEIEAAHRAANPDVEVQVQNLNKDPMTKQPIGGQYVKQSIPVPMGDKIDASLPLLQKAKQAAQEQANFKPSTITDPTAESRVKDMGSRAYNLRKTIENAAPEVAPLNQRQQESILLQKALRQGQKNPLAFVSTEAPDRLASIARAENRGAGGMLDFGNKYGAAKMIHKKDIDDAWMRGLASDASRAGFRGVSALNKTDTATAAPSLQAILAAILKK